MADVADGRPDKAAYDKEQDQLRVEIDALQAKSVCPHSLVDWGANWRRRGGGRRQTHAEGWPATRTRRAWMAARSSQSSAVCGTAIDWSRAPRLEPGVRSLLSVGRDRKSVV